MKHLLLVACLVGLGASQAKADGTFGLVLQGENGISTLQLVEKGGVRQGTLDGETVASQRQGNQLVLATGSQKETLTATPQGNNVQYKGMLDGASEASNFMYYPGSNGYEIKGQIAKTKFDLTVDQKKGELYLSWHDDQDDVTYDIALQKTSSTEAGSCKGNMQAASSDGDPTTPQDMATLECHSAGTLLDALFNNPEDAIAWLIHPNVMPGGSN
jgi:hypothetical protein